MPAYSSHYIFAREMISELSKLFSGKLNIDAVFFGTQGPDIFFFHRVMPWMGGKSLRSIGSRLHRAKPSDIFDAMADYVKSVDYERIAASYAYGFICHYAMDKNVHPFVYGWQKKVIDSKPVLKGFTVHNRIEFSIDTVLLHDILGVEKPQDFKAQHTVPTDSKVIQKISEMLVYVVEKVLNVKITKKDVETALRDLKYMEKITHDKTGIETVFLKTLSTVLIVKLFGYDPTAMIRPKSVDKARVFLNEEKRAWINPNKPQEKRNESFWELFEVAKIQCTELVKEFNLSAETGKSMANSIDNISFLTGVKVE